MDRIHHHLARDRPVVRILCRVSSSSISLVVRPIFTSTDSRLLSMLEKGFSELVIVAVISLLTMQVLNTISKRQTGKQSTFVHSLIRWPGGPGLCDP